MVYVFAGKKTVKGKKFLSRYGVLSLMALPGLLYLFINNYLPMFGIVVAFKNINYNDGILRSPWVGLKNFRFLFATPDAFLITRNTVLYNLTFIIMNLIVPVAIAVLLNEIAAAKLYRLYQSTFIIPFLVSYTVIGYIAYAFLSPDRGILNGIIQSVLQQEAINWYMEASYWPFIIIFVNTWRSFGYFSVIYLAAIVSIDLVYFEAATIDGVTRWQKIRYLIIPMIKPVIITMTLLQIGKIFYADFGLFYQVTLNSGILYSTTNVIDTHVYRMLMNAGNIGMASAAGFYQSVMGFIIILLTNMAIRKISREDALF